MESNYVGELKKYHKQLEDEVCQNYGVNTKYLEVISWGYHTTAIYIKADDSKEYLLKLADWSLEKEQGILKDIDLSRQLHNVLPTPAYLKTLNGQDTCRFEDKILRLSCYISGLSPLKMDFDILGQMISVLTKMHLSRPMTGKSVIARACGSKAERSERGDPVEKSVLLHGDLTPHNVLVSYGKLVAVMDFEMSCYGRAEWDLARTAVFSWNYMVDTPFEKVAEFVLTKYSKPKIDTALFYKYAVENLQMHLEAVRRHRADYDKAEDWERDLAFAQRQLGRMMGRVRDPSLRCG